MKKNIAVAGNIGSGKSLLIDFLCSAYPLARLQKEEDLNPYLKDFYADMESWSFKSQIFILTQKFCHIQKAATTFRSVIQNRTIHEDAEIFSRNLFQCGLMNEVDFKTYYDLYLAISSVLPAPDLLIYLHSSVNACLKRIKNQPDYFPGRINSNYLRQINRLYVNWIADYNLSEVIIIDTDQFNFAANFVDRADILEAIERLI
ncbi:MAG TPA: deoxynucleoside kinase [Proteobacteria bacterium]|nr:deoxynucleoside kinase [Pseudomonadota bacterium]